MVQVNTSDVEAIKDWISKQPHLPKNFDDLVIKKFIFSCNNSLERTKTCIDEFCTRRNTLPEIYLNRDPLSSQMKHMLSITSSTTYPAEKTELLIHRIWDISNNFDIYDSLKAFALQADNWILLNRDTLPENQILIIDLANYSLPLIMKLNIFFAQKLVTFLLETMPIRLSQIHLINCPSFYEYMYNIVKPVLSEDIRKMMHFHPDHTGLYDFVDKKCLPVDYGGEGEKMLKQQAHWYETLCEEEKRKLFLDDSFWKADLSKKGNTNNTNTMNGSFRTLAID